MWCTGCAICYTSRLVYFLSRNAEPQARCVPLELLAATLVSDPPTCWPSDLWGNLYGWRFEPAAWWSGFLAIAASTAFRWATMNSRRSDFTMHGDEAATRVGGGNFVVCGSSAGACPLCSGPRGVPCCDFAPGGGGSSDPWTSFKHIQLCSLKSVFSYISSWLMWLVFAWGSWS